MGCVPIVGSISRKRPTGKPSLRINAVVAPVFAGLHQRLAPYYSSSGRPSIDPEMVIRMLIIGYCHGIRSERRLCEEVALNLAYRWFCRLDLNDAVPDHSSFSKNRHGRFRESDLLRQVFEAVVRACMEAGLVKGEGFAVDASIHRMGDMHADEADTIAAMALALNLFHFLLTLTHSVMCRSREVAQEI